MVRNPVLVLLVAALASGFPLFGTAAFAQGPTGGLNLPDDFPVPAGLGKCKPLVISREVICQWHNVDQHATYVFYLAALPKAGYILLPGAQETRTPTFYMAGMGFKKGTVQGAVTIDRDRDLKVQVLHGPIR